MSSGGAKPSSSSPISSLLSQQTSTLPKPTQGMGSMMGGNFTPPPSQPTQNYGQQSPLSPLGQQLVPFIQAMQAQGRNGGKGGFPQGQRAELPFKSAPPPIKTNGIADLLSNGDQQ